MARYIVVVTDTAKKHIASQYKSGDKALTKRLERIFEELGEHPYEGIGKPEQLKHNLSGLWSRRIDDKNRLVYRVDEKLITVVVIWMK
ncbi:MAG: Txe/YoeB family addiction module toxin [Bacteroidales bacterium]|jgi:toxin YoeB